MKNIDENVIESSMQYDCNIYKSFRKVAVDEKINEISGLRLVVTDQLHCMISCILTYTPCIVFNNISKKLEGVYKWLKEENYIRICDDLNDLEKLTNSILDLEEKKKSRTDFKISWEEMASFIIN